MCPEQGTVSRRGGVRPPAAAGLGVSVPGLMVPAPRSLSSNAAAGKDFLPFDKIVFFLIYLWGFFVLLLFFIITIFSPESEPLKAVRGTTGISESRAVPRQPGSLAGGPLPPALPRPPWAGAISILPAGSGCDAGRCPASSPQGQPLRLCPSPRSAWSPVPSLSPRPSLASPVQRGPAGAGEGPAGTGGTKEPQPCRILGQRRRRGKGSGNGYSP